MNKQNTQNQQGLLATGYRLPATGFSRGVTVFLVLGFMGVFAIILGTISSYVLTQGKYGRALYAREVALNVAESGLEYYRWFLSHNPTIMNNGSGLVSPYTYAVNDPEGGQMGSAQVTATTNMQCGAVQWVDLVSRGVADISPGFPRTLSARYMRPSIAEYSYVVNTNVWAGSNRTIRGPYHSNGGVRMDATHNSDVTSAVATWNCDSGYGCNPTQSSAPGVVGNGSNPALWTYPVPTMADLFQPAANTAYQLDMKAKAQTQGGIYYGPASGSVNNRGYHLIFNSAGTVTIKRVSQTTGFNSYSTQFGYQTANSGDQVKEFSKIDNEISLGTFPIPSSCSLMFFEDRVWVEGTVNGKVTVVSATPSDSGTRPDVYLNGNILYNDYDGTDGLTVVAERNVLIPLIVPEVMEIHGVFVAQNGHYGRDYFWTGMSDYYDQFVTRSQLTTVGTVVSNGRTGTSWTDGTAFLTRLDYYDQQLAFSPPPFTPVASTDYQFNLWREQ